MSHVLAKEKQQPPQQQTEAKQKRTLKGSFFIYFLFFGNAKQILYKNE